MAKAKPLIAVLPRCITCLYWRVEAEHPTYCHILSTPRGWPTIGTTQATGMFICAADFGCVKWEERP